MNLEEKNYIEQQVANNAKNTTVAYVLLFFLGSIGAHRFYLGKTGSAIGLIVLSLLTFWMFMIPTIIWLIVDACLIPGYIREDQARVRYQAENEVRMINNQQ